MYLPEGVKIDTRKVRFNVIKGALNDIKCTQTQNDSTARIVWFDGYTPPEFFLTLYPHQRINRIPSMHIMCYKNSTFNAFNKMKDISKDLFNFFPHTYLLPEQLAKFKSDAEAIAKREAQKKSTKQPNPDSDPTTWIFKPKSGQCGIGIQLFQDCKQITAQYSGIVQNYIAPHLIDGFKFDFRMYVFVPTLDPLTIFIYKEGLARFCSGKYVKPNSQNMNDLYIHLTNTSVNVKNQDAHNEILQSFSTVFRRIGKPELWMKIKKVAALSIIAQYHSIVAHVDEEEKLLQKTANFMNPPEEASNIPKLGKFQRYFHLVGLDILINDKYEPIVLEMNDRPSMFVTSQEIEKDLKTGVVKDMLQMVTLDGSQPTKESRFGKWEQVFPMPGDPEFNKVALDSLRRSLPQSSYPSFLQPATQPPPKPQNKPPEMKKDNEETPKTESVETKGNDESNQIEISISAEIKTVQPNDTQQIKNQNSQTKIGNNASVRSSTNQIPTNKPKPKPNVTTKSQQLKGTRKLQPKPKEVKTVEPNEKEADKPAQQPKPKQIVKSTTQQKPKEAAATQQQQQKPKETAKPPQQPKQKAPTKTTQKPKATIQKKQPIPKESTRNPKETLPPKVEPSNKQEKEPIDNQQKPETTETKHQQKEKEVANQPKVSHNQQKQTEMVEPNNQPKENEITTQQTSNNQHQIPTAKHQVSNNQPTQKETTKPNNQPKENETTTQQATNNQHQVSNNQQKQTETTKPSNQPKEKEASTQQKVLNNQQKQTINQSKEKQTTQQQQVSNNQPKTKNENVSKPKSKDTTQKPKEQNKPLNQVKRETTTVVSQANRVVTDEKATEIIITYSTGTHLKPGNKMANSIKRQQQALKESESKQPTESVDKKKTITPKLENKIEPSIDHEKIKTIPKEKLPPLETDKHEVIEKEPMISITTSLPHLDHQ